MTKNGYRLTNQMVNPFRFWLNTIHGHVSVKMSSVSCYFLLFEMIISDVNSKLESFVRCDVIKVLFKDVEIRVV